MEFGLPTMLLFTLPWLGLIIIPPKSRLPISAKSLPRPEELRGEEFSVMRGPPTDIIAGEGGVPAGWYGSGEEKSCWDG